MNRSNPKGVVNLMKACGLLIRAGVHRVGSWHNILNAFRCLGKASQKMDDICLKLNISNIKQHKYEQPLFNVRQSHRSLFLRRNPNHPSLDASETWTLPTKDAITFIKPYKYSGFHHPRTHRGSSVAPSRLAPY